MRSHPFSLLLVGRFKFSTCLRCPNFSGYRGRLRKSVKKRTPKTRLSHESEVDASVLYGEQTACRVSLPAKPSLATVVIGREICLHMPSELQNVVCTPHLSMNLATRRHITGR